MHITNVSFGATFYFSQSSVLLHIIQGWCDVCACMRACVRQMCQTNYNIQPGLSVFSNHFVKFCHFSETTEMKGIETELPLTQERVLSSICEAQKALVHWQMEPLGLSIPTFVGQNINNLKTYLYSIVWWCHTLLNITVVRLSIN